MQESIEYQIFIGCADSQTYNEVVSDSELKEMVSMFFERNKINFSMLKVRGGYRHNNGRFITENSLCIDIVGISGLDIIKLAKGLSMYMNQECSLVTRNSLKTNLVFSKDNMDNNKLFEKGIKYEIFIGLKDKDSYIEILDVNDFKNIITQVCTHKQLSFSMMTQLGGYTHNKGYTTETSLRVVIIGADEDEITVLAEWLKHKINTDAVLITKTEIEYCFM
ncbi:MAG: hypothetical protein IJR59_07275 [Firmicutes bacterium]|nr:hypothetical protein [Bacillota bacterium]